FHLDHGDCRICRELGRYSTRKVAQWKWQVLAASPATCLADDRTTSVAISFLATPAMPSVPLRQPFASRMGEVTASPFAQRRFNRAEQANNLHIFMVRWTTNRTAFPCMPVA